MKLGGGVVPTLCFRLIILIMVSWIQDLVLGSVHLCVVSLDASHDLDSTRLVLPDVARKSYVRRNSVLTVVVVHRTLMTLSVAVAFCTVDEL